jgi:hypothetical protein
MTRLDFLEAIVTHDGVDTTDYVLYLDGTLTARQPVAQKVFDLGPLAVGPHTVQVEAVGPGGKAASAVVAFPVDALPPSAPQVRVEVRVVIA